MDNEIAMILVAVITAVGGVLVALIQSLRKEDRDDHEVGAGSLERLAVIAERTEDKVDTVKDELEEHLTWHEEDFSDGVERST